MNLQSKLQHNFFHKGEVFWEGHKVWKKILLSFGIYRVTAKAMFFKFCGLLRIYNNCISYHNHQKSHSFLSVQKIFEFWDGFRIRFVDKVLSEEAQKYLVVSNYKYQIFVAFSEYLNFNYAFLISDNSNILGTLKMKYS